MRNYDDRFDRYDYGSRNKRKGGSGCLNIILTMIVIVLLVLVISISEDRFQTFTGLSYKDCYELFLDGSSDLLSYFTGDDTAETIKDESQKSTQDRKDKKNTDSAKNTPDSHEESSHASEKETGTTESDSSLKRGMQNTFDDTLGITDESQAGYYCYNLLSDSSKLLYREILEAVIGWKEKKLSTLDVSELNSVYNYVLADHPEIFYSNGIHYTQSSLNGIVTSITVEGQYSMSRESASSYEASLTTAINNILAGVPGYLDGTETDDFTKLKYLYDYIITNTEYEEGSDENQNIISVLLNHRSVCNGYAKTFQYLSQLMGIPAILVTGYAEGGLHAWNVALMDGAWYQFDVTFGDSQMSQTSSGKADSSFINYAYFGLNDEEMSANHNALSTIPVPSCTETEGNYYVRTDTFFANADFDRISEIARKVQDAGGHTIQFRTENPETMDIIKKELFTNQLIYEYLNVTSCSYTLISSQNTLIIFF